MKLYEIGTIITGNTLRKNNDEYYGSDDIMFIKPSDIDEKYITNLQKSEGHISEKARNKVRILPKDTVLVTCIGTIGKVGILEKEGTCNQQINAIIPNDMIISKYLAYLIKSKQKILQLKANAPVVPIINKTDFSKIEINICDIKEQKRIVEKLDLVKKIIDIRQEQLRELNNIVKSQFVEMFGETSEAYKKHRIVKLSEIAEYYNGLTYKPADVSEMGTIVLRSGNIQNSKLEYSDIVRVKSNIKEKQYVKENDILMCSRNGSEKLVGKVAMIKEQEEKMTFGAFMLIIRSKYYTYLFSYFQSDDFRKKIKYGATTTINQITVNMLNKLELPMPEIKLQNQFSEIVKQIDKQKFESMIQLKMMEKIYNIINDRRRYV